MSNYKEQLDSKKKITSFKDLDIYQTSYQAMLEVHKEILPELPDSEKYDLKDQLSRSTKTIPRLIAEGYAKRHQKAGFQKYLDDVMGEANETVVGLEQCRDLYIIKPNLTNQLIDTYDKIGRQAFNLRLAWTNFKDKYRNR